MEASLSGRGRASAILALCLVTFLLVLGFLVVRDKSFVPADDDALRPDASREVLPKFRNIPVPFGDARSVVLRGALNPIGTTVDNRPMIEMTFDNNESSEGFGVGDLTFALTPAQRNTFSAGASLLIAFTPNKRFYGYKYTSRDGAEEQRIDDLMNGEPPQSFTYRERFPGTFFASDASLNATDSFPRRFGSEHGVEFVSITQMTLEENALYIIVAEEENIRLTVRGLSWCGDGTPGNTAGEQCDDGNTSNTDNCTNACKFPACGDTFTQPSGADRTPNTADDEQCDDGNQNSGDGCTVCRVDPGFVCDTSLTPTSCVKLCGNGRIDINNADRPVSPGDPPEENCDDGNQVSGDGCSASCTVEPGWVCLDGGVEPFSVTSPQSSCQSCSDTDAADDPATYGETTQRFGDGMVFVDKDDCFMGEDVMQWHCDAELGLARLSETVTCPYGCAEGACTPRPACFIDGVKDETEACDDNNQIADDGCTVCQIDPGYTCNTTQNPSVCQRCGNNRTEGTEQCDDGNENNTDTCTTICKNARCGDHFHQPSGADGIAGTADDEQCDAGDGNNGTGTCSLTCKRTVIIPF